MNFISSLPVWTGRVVRPILLASALAGGFCMARPVTAQDTKTADASAYTLSPRVFKTGDVNRYKLAMRNHLGEQDITVNLVVKETTKQATANGEFTLLNEFETAMANIGGAEQDISAFMPTVTVMRDKAGKLSSTTAGGNEAAGAQMSSMMQSLSTMQNAYFPKAPVKVGDKWKVTSTAPGANGAQVKSTGEATLVGTEIVGGVKSLKLKVVTDVDDKATDVKARSESTMNIALDSGKLLKMSAKVDGTAMGMKITQELDMSLVAGDKK